MSRASERATLPEALRGEDIDYLIHKRPRYWNGSRICVVRPGVVTLTNRARAAAGQITQSTTAVCLFIDAGNGNWTLSWHDVSTNQAVLYDFLWAPGEEDETTSARAIGRSPGSVRQARHTAVKDALKTFVAGTPADSGRGGFVMTAANHEGVADPRLTAMWCVVAFHGILFSGADISRMWAQGDRSDQLMAWWQTVLRGPDDGDME